MRVNRRTKRAARALYGVCSANGALDESRVRMAARHLAGSRRRGALTLLAAFQRLVRLDRDRHTALVESAVPLGQALQHELREDVARAYGGVEPTFAENPALIGGIRIKVGSNVYDGSVRARLDALASRL
jgi:F-type H+-transporting ATPase subunit delta